MKSENNKKDLNKHLKKQNKNQIRLGDYEQTYEQLVKQCYEANQSSRLADWFGKALLTYKQNEEKLPVDLRTVKALKQGECPRLDVIQKQGRICNAALQRLAVIKLNGGLGTSMGCEGPKSLIRITKTKRFIDIMLDQHRYINQDNQGEIPLLMMNSFYTDAAMPNDDAMTFFLQHRIPRVTKEKLKPLNSNSLADWTPPGHGNIYLALYESGMLETLLAQGKEILFISNSDNLGATIDRSIASYMLAKNLDFLMEVTPRTELDRKGGSVCFQDKALSLLERVQVASNQLAIFEDISYFQYFNTNTIWVRIEAIKEAIEHDRLQLPVMINHKMVHQTEVIQFETAMGAAIRCFKNSACIHVERDRFFPVKKTSDLLLLQSNLVTKSEHGMLKWQQKKELPTIHLSHEYQTITGYESLVKQVPDISKLRELTVKGPVIFNQALRLSGKVSIINPSSTPKAITATELINESLRL